jgi:hypothetical protein
MLSALIRQRSELPISNDQLESTEYPPMILSYLETKTFFLQAAFADINFDKNWSVY